MAFAVTPCYDMLCQSDKTVIISQYYNIRNIMELANVHKEIFHCHAIVISVH